MAERVVFLIDGFNLYHSLIANPNFNKFKWLNLVQFSQNFLPSRSTLVGTYYFSAICPWDTSKAFRHNIYIKALENIGVEVVLGKFKKVSKRCRAVCLKEYDTHEEKRTDVNIAIHLVSMAHKDQYDVAYLVTADSDLVPAVEEVRNNYPQKKIVLVTPIGRTAVELETVCNSHIKIKERHLVSSQFAHTITLQDGSIIYRPPSWV